MGQKLNYKYISVECWADKYFIKNLLQNDKIVSKEKNSSEVLKKVILQNNNNDFRIGIIDSDKHLFIKNFKLDPSIVYEIYSYSEMIKIIAFKEKNAYIIQLLPNEFEDFIIRFLELKAKNVTDFGYIDNLDLVKGFKRLEAILLKDNKFKQTIKFVLDNYSQSDNHIKDLKIILETMMNRTYQFNINDIKKMN